MYKWPTFYKTGTRKVVNSISRIHRSVTAELTKPQILWLCLTFGSFHATHTVLLVIEECLLSCSGT